MSWIQSGQFRLVTNRPGKHYVYRRANNGNSEYNVPTSVRTKQDAKRYLISKRNLAPSSFKAKRKPLPRQNFPSAFNTYSPPKNTKIGLPYHPGYIPGSPKYSPGNRAPKFSCDSRKDLIKVLGRGRQGIVYKGPNWAAKICPRDLVAAQRKDKQPPMVEFDNQLAAFKACPEGVVEPYDHIRCIDFIKPSDLKSKNVENKARNYDTSKQSVIFMELCTKGSLEDAIKNKISDSELMKYLTQIIRSLARITRKYPDFRHNDLWCANVFVTGRGALLGDFGWSRIKKNGTNPAVNTANGPLAQTDTGKWGVGPQTDARYDSHLILNDVRSQVTSKGGYPKCKAFLDWAVPVGYRGNSDLHVTQMRLKYRDPCPGLPTIDQIVASKYLKGFKLNANALAAGRALLRKTKTRKPLAARPRSINLQRAKAALRKTKAKALPKITSAMLKAAKARLRKLPNKLVAKKNTMARAATRTNFAIARKKVPIPRAVLKSNAFNRLVEKIRTSQSPKKIITSQGTYVNEGYNNARNRARTKAMNQVSNRINRGMDPFSNSPLKPKAKSPPSAKSPPKLAPLVERVVVPLIKSKVVAPKKARAVFINAPVKPKKARAVPVNKYARSPKSGRMKMKGPTGRMVYMNIHMSLDEVKKLAISKGKNTKGLRSKADILRKIFA
jgi:serine/threonine protein kinase